MGALAQAILSSLGQTGADIGAAQQARAKQVQDLNEYKLRLQQLQASIANQQAGREMEQARLGMEKERFGWEKQQAAQPKVQFHDLGQGRLVYSVQTPDGKIEIKDAMAGIAGGDTASQAKAIVDSVKSIYPDGPLKQFILGSIQPMAERGDIKAMTEFLKEPEQKYAGTLTPEPTVETTSQKAISTWDPEQKTTVWGTAPETSVRRSVIPATPQFAAPTAGAAAAPAAPVSAPAGLAPAPAAGAAAKVPSAAQHSARAPAVTPEATAARQSAANRRAQAQAANQAGREQAERLGLPKGAVIFGRKPVAALAVTKVMQPATDVDTKYKTMLDAYRRSEAARQSGNNQELGPASQAFAINYIGMVLNEQGTKRLNTAQVQLLINARSIPENLLAVWEKATTGAFLPHDQMLGMLNEANDIRVNTWLAAWNMASEQGMADRMVQPLPGLSHVPGVHYVKEVVTMQNGTKRVVTGILPSGGMQSAPLKADGTIDTEALKKEQAAARAGGQ